MITTELLSEKTRCSGCTACMCSCPSNAISMAADTEGFLYPTIDAAKCSDCGLCLSLCNSLGKQHLHTTKAYAAVSKNETIRLGSSSGGIFSILAENTLRRGGVVWGAAFDTNFEVCHITIENLEDMKRLMGSKYVQSYLSDSFLQVRRSLDSGREVLFSGTPCQIAGLKGYLHREYSNLTTVDLICHGVPSPNVWKQYINAMERNAGATVRRISFRAKNSSWKRFAISFSFANDTSYLSYHGDDLYMKGFLKNLCLRPSCYACRFKDNNRVSDITLADFWGIERVAPEMDDDKGTSLVIINSDKGNAVFSNIKYSITSKEIEADIIPQYNSASCRSVKPHPQREGFFADMQAANVDIMYLLRKYTKDTLKQRVKKLVKRVIWGVLKVN